MAERRIRRWTLPSLGGSTPPLVSAILESPSFKEQVDELAQRLGRSSDEVREEAAVHLGELSATHSDRVLKPWNRFGGWMLRGYDRLLDEEGLASLRGLDGKNSLAFLIAHRSYLDEWALPPALVEFGVDPPFGFAGANLNFFPLGTIARRTGIVHAGPAATCPSTRWRCERS
jgi:glycerol-3-phosphate O-acyltransferase